MPVFLVDVKGDLSGLCVAGEATGQFADRARQLDLGEYRPRAFPVVFWDVFGEQGHPIRATVSEMGPLLLARLLELNDTQEGVLNAAFAVADDNGLLLLDLKDLRAILQFISRQCQGTAGHLRQHRADDGRRHPAQAAGRRTRGRRSLLRRAGARPEGPDAGRQGRPGHGQHPRRRPADQQAPALRHLPAVAALRAVRGAAGGRRPRPAKLVLFFDEAHLLFDDAPKALIDKVEQVVRLIRSKGVGVFFVTQNPTDVPEDVLAQLGNRVQHALRAFTAKDQKAVKAAAETFRANPDFRVAQAITELAVGEALVSMLEDKGTPGIVQRTLIGAAGLAGRPGASGRATSRVRGEPDGRPLRHRDRSRVGA